MARLFPRFCSQLTLVWALLTLFCTILPTPHAQEAAQKIPFTLEADEVTYNDNNTKVTATGNVLVDGDQGHIKADKITYNPTTGVLMAIGNVNYTDPNKNTLTLNRLELSGDLKSATLEAIAFRLPDLGEVLTASKAQRHNEGLYELEDIVYSPCNNCATSGGRKPWQIRADSVKYNAEEEILSYRGAKFDVYGVPLLYLPYFYHPVGDKPKSGILPPTFGSSTSRGDEVTLSGYIFDPKNNADYTLRTRLMSSRGAQFIGERRQKSTALDTEFRGSYLNDTNTGNIRGHGQILGEYIFQPGRRAGLNAELTSDDDYLFDFFDRNDPYLPSTLYFEDASNQHYIGAFGRWYQDLDSNRIPAQTSHALPSIEAERIWDLDNKGTQLKLSGDAFALYRDEGLNYQRLSTQLEYAKPLNLKDGSFVEFTSSLRGDIYHVDGDDITDSGEAGRLIPEVTLGWEKPFVSATGFHTITPRVMGVYSPRGGNPDDIPNEDSVAYELDVTNLFQSSRFAGLDRVETGPQVIYGLDNRWGGVNNTKLHVFLGQSFRQFDDDALPVSGGTATQVSDWVGFVRGTPFKWLDFSTRFRLDNANFESRRQDTSVAIGYDRSDKTGRFLQMSHSFLDGGPEEFNLRGRWTFNKSWATTMRLQRDLEAERNLINEVGAEYTHCCFRVSAIARRRGFTNSNIQPSTDYLLNVQLLTLGRDRE